MNLVWAQLFSTLFFLLPIAVVWTARARATTAPWELALSIPQAVAIDILGILLLARFLRLEVAILVSRSAWIVALPAVTLWRRKRGDPPAWPSAIGWRQLATVVTAAVVAVALFFPTSRTYSLWDREWHTPLVPSIAGQKLPFFNVYGAGESLHYHIAGDVSAAVFRTLSLDMMSSNLSLSLAHDVYAALIASTVALLLMSFGNRRFLPIVLGGIALLIHGSFPLRADAGLHGEGFAYHNFYTLSYRPHVLPAGLLLVGFFGTLALRAHIPDDLPARKAIPLLLATAALLAVTDEASLALVGLGLGATWLVFPRILGLGRLGGLGVMLALLAAFVVPNLLFSGSLAPGGPVNRTTWTPVASVPSFYGPEVFPTSTQGLITLFCDFFPFVSCWLALLIHAVRARSRMKWALVLMGAVIIATCAILTTHLRINGTGTELQRVFVAPFFMALLFGLLFLREMPRGSVPYVAVLFGTVVPAAYTIFWVREIAPPNFAYGREHPSEYWRKESTYGTDCRRVAGARFGDTPRPTYIDMSLHYVYSSCRPIFGPGAPGGPWKTRISPLSDTMGQLSVLDKDFVGSGDLDAICAASPQAQHDQVCSYAVANRRDRCTAEGDRFIRCPLTASDRKAILGR